MTLLSTLASLPSTSYAHPIPSPPEGLTRLNPYLPLPAGSTLFTDGTFLQTLPTPSAGSIVHVVSASTVSIPRSDDAVVLISRTSQQGYDHALLGLAVAREGGIVYHFIAKAALSGEVLTIDDVEGWLSQPASPVLNGHANGDASETPAEKLLAKYEAASLSLLKTARRAQRPFIHHHAESSKLVINFLPTSIPGVNSLDIALASPLPRDKIRHAGKPNDEVIVVEAGSTKFGPAWASTVEALEGLEVPVRSVLVGKVDDVAEIKAAIEGTSPIARVGSPLPTPSVPSTSIAIPSAESSYTNLLTTSPSPLEILNDPTSLSANESTSPLYAFGKALAIRQERDRLLTLAKEILKAEGTKPELHEALAQWLIVRDEPKSAAVGEQVVAALPSPSTDAEKELIELGAKGHWTKRSLWIVISNSWSYDLASSGLHHTLASGLDVNLLVYETAPSPFSPLAPAQPARERKKDLALYALNMGDIYVSSVAVYADYSNVINAMREAESFSGPGLVLAYLPWGEKEDGKDIGHGEKAGPLQRLQETKRAVAGGWWPLFRFDPRKSEDKQFIIDSPIIKEKLREFLDRQSHLSQLTLATPNIDVVPKSAGETLVASRKQKAREAYDRLVNSMDGPGLLVLFASDGGNAEKVAKRLVSRAKTRGVAASIGVLDSIAPTLAETLQAEANVVIITSTAGQGEAPQNGREFHKALGKASPDPAFAETELTVFAMGDSNYWPRKEDYVYYNKPGKDFFAKLSELGFGELTGLGLGDDQDPDGWQTGYKPWEAGLWRGLGVDSVEVVEAQEETVANEHIKIASDYLRGTILEGLNDTSTGAIGASDAQLTKFHGTYMQDDRDIRESLKAQGLEPAYSFMIRVRLPGGVCTPEQWLAMDRISDEHGNSTFKLTTRQTFQFHGIIKRHLKPAMQSINRSLLDTIAACGDVNRNVQVSCNPLLSRTHAAAYAFAKGVSEHLLPKTSAYHEIWLDKKQVAGGEAADFEPLYGPTYLPRKFKIAVAVPPDNAVDVFTNDVGFIAIVGKNGDIEGYNVSVGGGMGVTHSNKKTYPRLGDVIGFVTPEEGNKIAESIMLVQRDNGNRQDRKNARLKYTIDNLTLPVFKSLVEERFGKQLAPARPFEFTSNVDNYGWVKGHDGHWHFTMFIENGRVEDNARHQFKAGLKEIASHHKGDFRLTANQHLILADVKPEDKPEMERLLAKWGLDNIDHSGLRLSSSACVAFPTCGLAMAESERYLPILVDKVEKTLEEEGMRSDSIVMRMTGCPNGCARPWVAELAFVGKAPGSYMVMLGGNHLGTRLSKPIKSSMTEPEILAWLKPLIKRWAIEREDGEHFGDWSIRAGIVAETTHGTNFWANTDAS
ncbi:hypothetical protein BCR39DRAFT_32499 [Naematelia encephala]|uniref:assimilatory sulfite reductase (NADPH) n=1 Tax=Naematelia encephala TaxID=71784 RepID=A0A1Y2BLY0_9TREE|nr:hypothetical protein BCR39DRAFT_32499 [Naematelia encephala]